MTSVLHLADSGLDGIDRSSYHSSNSILDYDVVVINGYHIDEETQSNRFSELLDFRDSGRPILIYGAAGCPSLLRSLGAYLPIRDGERSADILACVEEFRSPLESTRNVWSISWYATNEVANPVWRMSVQAGEPVAYVVQGTDRGAIFVVPDLNLPLMQGNPAVSDELRLERLRLLGETSSRNDFEIAKVERAALEYDQGVEAVRLLCRWAATHGKQVPVEPPPEWVDLLPTLPGEAEAIDQRQAACEAIELARSELDGADDRLAAIRAWKRLFYASGDELEAVVNDAFELLGFTSQPTEDGRADHRMLYQLQPVVVETKGRTKSAAERDAAQLEKWVTREVERENPAPKAVLVVNGWKDTPAADRDEQVFPDQMLSYAEGRKHCLITGAELYDIVAQVLIDPNEADRLAQTLLHCVGRYADR